MILVTVSWTEWLWRKQKTADATLTVGVAGSIPEWVPELVQLHCFSSITITPSKLSITLHSLSAETVSQMCDQIRSWFNLKLKRLQIMD